MKRREESAQGTGGLWAQLPAELKPRNMSTEEDPETVAARDAWLRAHGYRRIDFFRAHTFASIGQPNPWERKQ